VAAPSTKPLAVTTTKPATKPATEIPAFTQKSR